MLSWFTIAEMNAKRRFALVSLDLLIRNTKVEEIRCFTVRQFLSLAYALVVSCCMRNLEQF